nr:Protein C34F6.11 [Haemonchus contortus]
MVHSSLYTEVSCSNGVNFFIPFINVVSSFAGLVAIRALHLTWPAFVHVVTLLVAFPSLLIVATVTYIEADIWYKQATGTPEPIPAEVTYTNWAKIFADLDVLITFVVLLNMVIIGGEILVYLKYWFLKMDRTSF